MRRWLLPLALLLAAGPLAGQTVKTIAVSAEASYTDHLSLAEDSRDMDVMVKFIFDESQNTLKVSLLSYRSLFVFRDAVRYSSAVSGGKRLRPDQLPYVAESDPGVNYYLSKDLRKSLPRVKKNLVFRRWVEYDGLQPAPMEYKMVNDFIEQTFDILQKRETVTVTLRDIYLLEPVGYNYQISSGRDLDTRYQIRIQRNPCFGLEKDLELAQSMVGEVKTAFEGFRQTYASGEVPDQEALKAFEDTRTLLLTQFPPRENVSPCPDIKEAVEQYNHYLDSISSLPCKVFVPEPEEPEEEVVLPRELDVKLVYSQARQLDKSVARWLVSKDSLERQDLIAQGQAIIADMNELLAHSVPGGPDVQKAVKVYRQAEQYFKKTCLQQE